MKPGRHWLGIAASVVLGVAGCAHVRPGARSDEGAERDYYLHVVDALNHGGQADSAELDALDFTRLRRARGLSASEAELSAARALGDKLVQARTTGDGKTSLHVAEELLAGDFTDVVAHLEKARLLHYSRGGEAAFHEAIARGLLQSIFAEYTVQDPTHPLRVYSRREEDVVLEYLELTPLSDLDQPAARAAQAGQAGQVAISCRDRQGRARVVRFERASRGAPGGD